MMCYEKRRRVSRCIPKKKFPFKEQDLSVAFSPFSPLFIIIDKGSNVKYLEGMSKKKIY